MRRPTRILAMSICLCCAAGPGYPDGDADSWCPTGRDLDSYLEAKEARPGKRPRRLESVPPPPVVTPMGGVLLIEDWGEILRDDRAFDLPMESIELVPSGDGFQVSSIPSAYEPVTVPALFTGASSWRSEPVSLSGFAFPFGGELRTQFWVTSTNLVAFEMPAAPVNVGLCNLGCYIDEGQVLLDRLPRISPLQHGTTLYGWNAFVQEESDRVIITWRYADPQNLDVQAVLFSDGRIRLNYAAVAGILHGAVVVVSGNDAFWSDLRLGGQATDPAGDVTIAAPDGPGMDLVSATVRQVGTSELLQVEFTLLAPPPPVSEEERIFYSIEVRDDATDPEPVGSIVFQWQRGAFYWMTEPAILDGSTLRLHLRLDDLPLDDNDLHLTFTTFRGNVPYEEGDRLELSAVFAPPGGPMMLDLTADLPVTLGDSPVYEAFTLPALQTGAVLEALAPLFEDPSMVEAFAIYQNLQTDIFFFAGAYHAGGNAGADGIGYGSSSAPRSPSLLHLNNIYGYSAEDWTMTVLSHEFGHRWLYHFAIDDGGSPSRILNPAGAHPAGWVHTPAVQPVYRPQDYSLMGGSNWSDNGDGTFTSPPAVDGGPNGYTWHELYLMGLADPVEVEDWWYIENPVPPLPNAYWAPNDTTVAGGRVPVNVGQIIAAEGPRFPAYPDTLQYFLTPVVMVSRPGAFTQAEIDTISYVCTLWESRFSTATNGRGSLRCLFDPPVVDITVPASDVTVLAGDTIGFEGVATDADGDAVELRWSFSGAAPDATGPGPHPVTFTSTGAYLVRLAGVDESGMLATEDDTAVVTVECPTLPPADPVDGLLLSLEAGGIRFTWTDLPVAPDAYAVLGSDAPGGPFYLEGTAASGAPGLLLPEPAAGLYYYEVAARNAAGCLGPY